MTSTISPISHSMVWVWSLWDGALRSQPLPQHLRRLASMRLGMASFTASAAAAVCAPRARCTAGHTVAHTVDNKRKWSHEESGPRVRLVSHRLALGEDLTQPLLLLEEAFVACISFCGTLHLCS
jgi:hypothetical protein